MAAIWNDLGRPPKMSVSVHYPGQYLLRLTTPHRVSLEDASKRLKIRLHDIEIIKSRNSRNRNCTPYDHLKPFDDIVREKHIKDNQRRAPYLAPFQEFPKCSTPECLKACIYDYDTVRKKYPISCQRLSRLSVQVTERESHFADNSTWELEIVYPKSSEFIRIITQSKEVDIHALIGNIGGYIGLFLGNISTFFC